MDTGLKPRELGVRQTAALIDRWPDVKVTFLHAEVSP